MNLKSLCNDLAGGAALFRSLVQGVSQEEACIRPSPDSWSILEVICHLYDEEREDFRARIDFILKGAHGAIPPIDPQGWVFARNYNQRSLEEMMDAFLKERSRSLEWLRSLENPDWTLGYQAPFGFIRAGDIAASWAAHDYLHARQLVELRYQRVLTLAAPYNVRYAGEW